MVEGARLESVYRGNSIEGSNPSLSATVKQKAFAIFIRGLGNSRPAAIVHAIASLIVSVTRMPP